MSVGGGLMDAEEARSRVNVTQLLVDWSEGDSAALERLMPIIYDELRRLAAHYMRKERPDHTLQPTALVHEAYLRLIDQKTVKWQNRAHFFGLAARMMRRVLVDHARGQQRAKRGGGIRELALDEAGDLAVNAAAELVALDDALVALAEMDPRKCRVVELRYFAGLSVEETAEIVGVSVNTVMRDWTAAKAWLYNEMKNEDTGKS